MKKKKTLEERETREGNWKTHVRKERERTNIIINKEIKNKKGKEIEIKKLERKAGRQYRKLELRKERETKLKIIIIK